MVSRNNLQQVMNEVSRNLDQTLVAPKSPSNASDELVVLSGFDPLLSDLRKQYLDARAMRLRAEKDFGAGDGMCDMAALLEDSAWCAMQTCYMEVRNERVMMARAQAEMARIEAEEERASKAAKEKEARETYEQMVFYTKITQKQKELKDNMFWFLLLWLLMGPEQNLFRNFRAGNAFRFAA